MIRAFETRRLELAREWLGHGVSPAKESAETSTDAGDNIRAHPYLARAQPACDARRRSRRSHEGLPKEQRNLPPLCVYMLLCPGGGGVPSLHECCNVLRRGIKPHAAKRVSVFLCLWLAYIRRISPYPNPACGDEMNDRPI